MKAILTESNYKGFNDVYEVFEDDGSNEGGKTLALFPLTFNKLDIIKAMEVLGVTDITDETI